MSQKIKKCSYCEKYYKMSDFSWKLKRLNKRSNKCRQCTNEYSRKHYIKYKHKYKKRVKVNTEKYKKERRDLVYEFKLSNPCASCGESNPIVLEFHHLDPKEKRNDVSNMASHGYSAKSIEKEIEKCIILCANCHRKKTAKQQNWHSHKRKEGSKTWEEQ
tara:strand:+ start:1617 stop:2096 length:480 start_codon:yes stop_codon:yes gene_type:complete